MGAAGAVHASTRALQAFVPRLASEWLSDDPERTHLAVDGTLAFVDISGFTTLTERLARVGRAGSEELSDILSATFGALLTAAREDGADLVKWGGDAVLLLFRGDDHASHAVRAAARMRQVLRDVGRTKASAGRVTLRMSVGVHSGLIHFYLVGNPAIHRELIVCGPAATITAEMESIANAGQIVVSDSTAERLSANCVGARVDGGWVLRSVPDVNELSDGHVDTTALDVGALLSPPIREHLIESGGDSEHRPVAVAFVEFSGTDAIIAADGAAGAAKALDECVRSIQAACAMHGVTFLESDINRDGGKILLVSGAPLSAGGDDDRLLRAVSSIVASRGRLRLRAGVNHGRVFSGDFGPEFRRTYSVKGDAVNVAARVMGRAQPGTVVATDLVMARAETTFDVRHLDPFMVKGKSEPIAAVVLGAPQEGAEPEPVAAQAHHEPFVGRAAELTAIRSALDRARTRRGAVIDIVGEPGMGKSRLVEESVREASDFVIVRAPSASYESKTPYFAFRNLLRDILGLRRSHHAEATAARLTARVEMNAPHLIPWLPLLGVVLDADLPATRETTDLDERFRRARLEDVLMDFLRLALPTPAVLIFENTHLIDDASADLLGKVESGADSESWVVLMTRRDLDAGYRSDGRTSHYSLLPLTPIAGAEAVSLLESVTRTTPLSSKAMEAIAAKADGNPLFLKALVGAASRARSEDELPDSIEAVLTSEVDRLPSDARTLLRFASVLGVRFSEVMLREVVAEGGQSGFEIDLGRLRGFVEPEGDGGWRFQHALVRDAAYAGLPYRLRRVMHQRAGSVLEATAPSLEEVSERLSLHFFHAADFERAWTYSRMAGRRAHSLNAHGSAIEFFERAIEAGRSCGAPRSDLGDIIEELGDVCDVAGQSRDAVAAYRRARPFRRDDALRRAGLLLKEAGLHQRLGAFVTSMRLLTYARTILRDTDGPEFDAARARLATRYAFGTYLQGDYARALRWSEIGLREAQSSGDSDAVAYAYNTLHVAYIHAGVDEEEPYGELALAAYQAAGDLRMQAHCLNNLAIGALHDGEWIRSADLLDQAAEMFRRVGDTANEANAQYNRADLLIRQRRFLEAEPLLYVALREAYAADDRELVGLATRELGRALMGQGRDADALARFETAREAFTDLGLAQELLSLDEAVAECLLAMGEVDQAIALAEGAIVRAHELGHDNVLAALHRVHGFALLAAGRRDEARATFEAGVLSPNAGDGRRDYALILLGFAELTGSSAADDAALMRDESRRILDALGVTTESLRI